MSKIEAVIFDAGGVLHESNSVVTDDLVSELGLEQETLNKIWAKQIPLLGSGKIDEAEFWQQVSSEHGIRKVEVAENLLGRAFTEALKPHAKALREAGLYDGFDYLFLSHEVGMRKPNPAIYEDALEKLSTTPEATIFVDDDPKNVEAAAALGIKGIVFIDPEQLVADIRSLVFAER